MAAVTGSVWGKEKEGVTHGANKEMSDSVRRKRGEGTNGGGEKGCRVKRDMRKTKQKQAMSNVITK